VLSQFCIANAKSRIARTNLSTN